MDIIQRSEAEATSGKASRHATVVHGAITALTGPGTGPAPGSWSGRDRPAILHGHESRTFILTGMPCPFRTRRPSSLAASLNWLLLRKTLEHPNLFRFN